MSLSNVTIYNNKLAKKHVDFQQSSTLQGKLFKYLGGDSLVYKNYTIEDQNGDNYAQLYNVSGTLTTDNAINIKDDILQYGYALLPKFTVVMFSGAAVSIPAGWLLCDGRTATINGSSVTAPDLRGRFVLSLGQGPLDFTNNTVGATGGEQKHTLTVGEMPSHNHDIYSINDDFNGSGTYPNFQKPSMAQYDSTGDKTWTDAIESVGGGGAHNTMPPYYVLCFIMKGF
jgi:microcystin-dependent protein